MRASASQLTLKYFTRLSQERRKTFSLFLNMNENLFFPSHFRLASSMLLNMAFHMRKLYCTIRGMSNWQIIKLANSFKAILFDFLSTPRHLKRWKNFFSTFHHCFLIFFNFTFRTIFLFKFHDRSFIMQSLINNFSFRIFFDCPLIAFSFHFKSHYVIHKIRAGKFMNVMNSGSPFENFSNDEQTKYPLRCYHLRVRKPF